MWLYVSIKIRLSNHHVKGGTITVVERLAFAVSLLIVHCLQGLALGRAFISAYLITIIVSRFL